jgi:hypothetical protein
MVVRRKFPVGLDLVFISNESLLAQIKIFVWKININILYGVRTYTHSHIYINRFLTINLYRRPLASYGV